MCFRISGGDFPGVGRFDASRPTDLGQLESVLHALDGSITPTGFGLSESFWMPLLLLPTEVSMPGNLAAEWSSAGSGSREIFIDYSEVCAGKRAR